jgi:Fe-Mn family superoxide dismutase
MPIEFVALPYSPAALEPYLSAKALGHHHGQLQRDYVEALNARIQGTAFAELTLEQIVQRAQGSLFQQAAQVWNHNFYWQCLRPLGGGEPTGKLAELIAQSFGSFSQLQEEFEQVALSVFGSGWVWLVQRPNTRLAVVTSKNANTPLTGSDTPLLACDVWEHAYYAAGLRRLGTRLLP